MSNTQIIEKIIEINKAFDEFKAINEEKMKALENKQPDSLILEKLHNIELHIEQLEQERQVKDIVPLRPMNFSGGEEQEHKAFVNYIKTGVHFEKKSDYLSGNDNNYMVSKIIHSQIIELMKSQSVFRNITKIERVSGDLNEYIQCYDELNDVGWVEENDPRFETSSPHTGQIAIKLKEMYAQPKITANFLNDSAINIESWITEKISSAFVKTENNALFWGDGNRQPIGLLKYNTQDLTPQVLIEEIQTIQAKTIEPNDLFNMLFKLDSRYMRNACFIASPNAVRMIRTFQDPATKVYLWQPSLASGTPNTLMGLPIYISKDLQMGQESGQVPMLLGDFNSGALLVDCTINIF